MFYRIDTVYQLYDKYVDEWIKDIDKLECDGLCNYCEFEDECINKLLNFDEFCNDYEDYHRED